ncbi:DoxX family protein [Paludibaculum fermentans]|uniref:DoxX family protein n=1 Tax=Paludibaculum fermentans TaxID=1473598 RepID=UPI003EB970E2
MTIFIVLLSVTLLLRGLGALGVDALANWGLCLRGGLAAMFLLTASAHWGRRRPDLIRMVPPAFPRPDVIVTLTGYLEILGAVGLLLPTTARLSAACLAVLLLAMFPANIRAAREHLSIGGQAATALWLRTALQVIFVAALAAIALDAFA